MFVDRKSLSWMLYAFEGQRTVKNLCKHDEQSSRAQNHKHMICGEIWDEWITWS